MINVQKYTRITNGVEHDVAAHQRGEAAHRFTNARPAPTDMDAIRARRAMSPAERARHDRASRRAYRSAR